MSDMQFEFATASRIIFGSSAIKKLNDDLVTFGERCLIVCGSSIERADPVVQILKQQRIGYTFHAIIGEPTIDSLQDGISVAHQKKYDFVIGIGGGSALDAGKAIAIMVRNEGDLLDYLEVVGKKKKLKKPGLPYIAIPTTAGTGTEVTRNAVISVPEMRVKVSLRSHLMLPTIAVVDPVLTYDLPPEITASTGLDALTQLIEPFVSTDDNPLIDVICQDGIRRIARSIRFVYSDHYNQEKARQDMSLASLYGGIAPANAKLGAVHGFAGPLGGMYSAPHGMLCASLLPYVMEKNIQLLQNNFNYVESLNRFKTIAKLLTGNEFASPNDGVDWLVETNKFLNIKTLSQLGVNNEEIPEIIQKAKKSSSMKGNPIQLGDDDLMGILLKAL